MDSFRTNAGFVITTSIPVGNAEFVLGVNMKNPNSFVTWECKGQTDYFWGHYTDSLLKATKDLCQRAMDEILYLEQREEKAAQRNPDRGYHLEAFVKYGDSSAVIQFPTPELEDVLGSIGITQPPEKVYLKAYSDIEVQLQNGGNKVSDALVRLFRDDNSLRMVNEVAKAVFHSDCRVYEWVEKNLRDDRYKSVEDVLRDAVDYGKYLKDVSHKQKKAGGREER